MSTTSNAKIIARNTLFHAAEWAARAELRATQMLIAGKISEEEETFICEGAADIRALLGIINSMELEKILDSWG